MLLIFILSGMLSGLCAGLLGIGGGIVTVPVLYYTYLYLSPIPPEQIIQVSICTSLAATSVTALVSTWAHQQKQNILPTPLLELTPGLLIGCVAGAIAVQYIPSTWLRILFGSMAILFGLYFFFPRLPQPHLGDRPTSTLALFGLVIGALSSLLGVGGGIFIVPLLLAYNTPLINAIATSSAATLFSALVGSITYLFIAWDIPELPHTFGYIEIPAFLAVSLGSLTTARLGVRLARTLPKDKIQKVFASMLGITGVFMLVR